MAALVRNVLSNSRGIYRICIAESSVAFVFKGGSSRPNAKIALIPCGSGAKAEYSSLSSANSGKEAYEPKYGRRRTDSIRTRPGDDDPPFHEDTEALGRLSRRHREGGTSEHTTAESQSFSEFPIHPFILEALENLGYKSPFEIQTKTLEHTLGGRDVVGQAVTGSGKTLAFAIPIVHKIRKSRIDANEASDKNPRAIVVAPTRELCNQIYRSIQEIDPKVRCVALYGGDSYVRQEREIHRGVDVICATPGRLNDHLERKTIGLRKLEFLCLDEADELLNPNFREQIEGLFQESPNSKQVLMFSATMPPEIQDIASRYLRNPEMVFVGGKLNVPQNIEHQCICAPSNTHLSVVAKMISQLNAERCIVFLKTKVYCGVFANNLRRLGLSVDALHSDLSQSRRERILSSFRMGSIKVLCATDVAARGLDIPEVDVVFQVEPPANGIDYYIHRAGRTGRAGRKGLAVLLHTGTFEDMKIVRQIGHLVELKHVTTKDEILEDIRENNLNDALKKLSTLKVTNKDKELVTPIAEKLLASEDNVLLLSKVLTLLSRSNIHTNFRDDIDRIPQSFSKSYGDERRPTSRSFGDRGDRYPRRQSKSLWDAE